METVEDFMNGLSDKDWGWWPFLFLRPSKDQFIDNSCLFKMTAAFGTFVGFFLFLISLLLDAPYCGNFLVDMLGGWLFFFLSYKYTFALFWNRRARRLRTKA
jgi:hypothetical protein